MRTRIVQVVEPAWLDVAAAARYCSCSVPTVRRAIRADALEHRRVGRVLRTKREWCDRWLESGGRTRVEIPRDHTSPDNAGGIATRVS